MTAADAEREGVEDVSEDNPYIRDPDTEFTPIDELSESDAELVGHLVVTAKKIATDEGGDESGYRLVWNCGEGAGQTVFHIHLHLLSGRGFKWPPG